MTKLPAGLTENTIPGQRGRLYEFDVADDERNVKAALTEAGLGGMFIHGGAYVQVQTWDRSQALAAYEAVRAGGCTIIGTGTQ